MMFTHWHNLEPEHWAALRRCCESSLGRAQLDDEVAAPLVDLGWIERRGYGYAPTRPGHAAHEAGPPAAQPEPPRRVTVIRTPITSTPSSRPSAWLWYREVVLPDVGRFVWIVAGLVLGALALARVLG